MAADISDDDTTPTEEDGLLDQLRHDGILGPFRVADWSGGTDVGTVRARNEDAWDVLDDRLFVVADGIGGHEGGEVAARAAVDNVLAGGDGFTEANASEIAARANTAVRHAGLSAGFETFGTTIVALAAHRHHVVVLGVGDSRAYRIREGELEQLTRDHTVRNELLASGVPLERAQESNIRLDALTSSLGRGDEAPVVHAASYSVMAGDRFLLCSDGVHGQVSADRIVAAMTKGTCEQAAASLLSAARDGGGRDNATAIVIEFDMANGVDR